MKIKVGDFVKVKKGITDPDFPQLSLEGWQGEVIEITEEDYIVIELDYTSLAKITEGYLIKIAKGGSDWWSLYLEEEELEKTDKREEEENAELLEELQGKYYWCSIFEERGLVLYERFKEVNTEEKDEVYKGWMTYLNKTLTFPLLTIIDEDAKGRFRLGDDFNVSGLIEELGQIYGIFAIGEHKGGAVQFPLCNIEVVDTENADYQKIRDYRVWFANY